MIALARGKRERAAGLLETASEGYDAVDMPVHAAACRRRLGELRDDDTLITSADAFLRERGVVSPEKWTQVLLPICPAS